MRRALMTLLAAVLGASASQATPHPNVAACLDLRAGLDRAYDLSWVGDPIKAERIRPAFAMAHFYGLLLATALENGGSLETTRSIEADFVSAGNQFEEQAKLVGVTLPDLNAFLERSAACSAPYN